MKPEQTKNNRMNYLDAMQQLYDAGVISTMKLSGGFDTTTDEELLELMRQDKAKTGQVKVVNKVRKSLFPS